MRDAVRARVVISGRVQGVFFRDTVRNSAMERGITGWVRNRPDGRVEAELQGPSDDVDALVDLCRVGPQKAEVTDLDVRYQPAVEGERGFVVR